MELIDIYDKNGEKTNKIIERVNGLVVNKDEYILCIQCWIINKNGEILLTQRNKDKDHGGIWESTGGCVLSGETSRQAALREIKEELGIIVDKEDLKYIKRLTEIGNKNNHFRDIYVIQKDITLDNLNFSDNEVVNAKFVSISEFEKMIENNEVTNWSKHFKDEYYKLFREEKQ